MKKLDDIPKKSVFKVPEGYFDQLPTTIQARMAESHRTPAQSAVSFSLKYALPVVALIAAGIFWFRPGPTLNDEFEDIDTDQIALYLSTTEQVDTEEVYEEMEWSEPELDDLEGLISSGIEISDDIDLESL